MRYYCYLCGKSVTSELPDDSVIRAVLICPECIEKKEVIFPADALLKNVVKFSGGKRGGKSENNL